MGTARGDEEDGGGGGEAAVVGRDGGDGAIDDVDAAGLDVIRRSFQSVTEFQPGMPSL